MKSLVCSLGIAAGIVLIAGVHNASAQITGDVEFTTAFPFAVGPATVPAGRYTIEPDLDHPEILLLTGTRASVFFQTGATESRETPSKTEVVFKRYGDSYVLKEIWIEGSSSGAEAIAGEGERHASKGRSPEPERRVSATKRVGATKKVNASRNR